MSHVLSFAELWFTVRIIEVIWFKSWCTKSIGKSLPLESQIRLPHHLVDEVELGLH